MTQVTGSVNVGGTSYPCSASVTLPASTDPITHRPNDGSGTWADRSNTGYQNYSGTPSSTAIPCTHGYAGLFDYAAGMNGENAALFVTGGAGTVFTKIHFRGAKIYLNNEGSGTNWTFNGCVFDGTVPKDNLVDDYVGGSTTYNYCTVKPDQVSTPPGNTSYAHTTSLSGPGTPWNKAGGSQSINSGSQRTVMNHCDVWGGAALCNVYGGTSAAPTTYSWCYIHDEADADWSTVLSESGSMSNAFHQDGIGPDTGNQMSGKSSQWIVIDHCTICSLGTSNGIAFQSTASSPPPVTNVKITNCYLGGFGITVSLGAQSGWQADTNITFENNVLTAEVPFVYRALYGMGAWNPANGMVWKNNRWQFFAGDPLNTFTYSGGPAVTPTGMSASWNGTYWWPTDTGSHASDYVFS